MTDEVPDWDDVRAAAEKANYGPRELRELLPIGYVLSKYGHELVDQDDHLAALCPFHEDTEPSFDVWGENLEFCGCYPCFGGQLGDVVDLIQQLEGCNPATAVEVGNALVAESPSWKGPRKGTPRKKLDLFKASKFVNDSFTRANISLLDAFCLSKSLPFAGAWLHNTFGVGTWDDWLVIPFYKDEALGAFKRRTLTTKPRAAAGANFDELFYNHWRLTDDPETTIILCEGESDTWATHFAVGDTYTVLGIPTGAGDEKGVKSPVQAPLLANRKVILAFDGDSSGQAAREAWAKALRDVGCTANVAPVPAGKDMCTVKDIPALITAASEVQLRAPSEIRADTLGYIRPGKKSDSENTDIANWYFKAERELTGEHGLAWEGTVEPRGIETVLSSFDLKGKANIVSWSARHKSAWVGSDRDAQLLQALLQSEGPMLAKGSLATKAGLNDGHFVWPGHSIGPDYWRYVAPPIDVRLDSKIFVEEGEWSPDLVHKLRSLHTREVMDPILAWLAAVPVRSLLREFPPLSVTGSSGTGKTTLTEAAIQAFTSSSIANNLTSTTSHALFSYLGCTNAFPVWFDEYRPGARKDALRVIEQLIRDAYTGQASSKGGMDRDNWAVVTQVPMDAPLVVSGEDAFSEQSHTERMVLISLPMQGKNPDALREVRAMGQSGFAHAYLTWIQKGLDDGSLPDIVNRSLGPDDLPPRQRINMGVLTLGWELLSTFMEDSGSSLSSPNFDLVIREALEAQKRHPIEDALRWATGEPEAGHFVFYHEIDGERTLCVRVENLVNFINKSHAFTLPGGITAVKRHLTDKYGAQEIEIFHFGAEKRVLALRADAIKL